MTNIKVVEDDILSKQGEKRYVVVDTETGEILDNAQGYGYKTIQKAYSAYAYKTRDKSKDHERLAKQKKIKKWLTDHKDFAEAMGTYSLEIAKGSFGHEKFNAKFVDKMLKDNNLEIDFTAAELLKVWKKIEY